MVLFAVIADAVIEYSKVFAGFLILRLLEDTVEIPEALKVVTEAIPPITLVAIPAVLAYPILFVIFVPSPMAL
jgi:hypothetical protein